jgi:hypothetical protein
MKKYIVLSVNDNPDYLFHVPLVCWAWRKFGWEPIVFYTGDGPTSNGYQSDLVFNDLWENVYVIKVPDGYSSSTIAQVSRLYAAHLAFKGEIDGAKSFLMTSDIDMLPLSDYWKPDYDKLTVYGRDLTDYHYPICYIAANNHKWDEIMDFDGSESIDHFIARDLRKQKNIWTLDQDIITERINDSRYVPLRIDRGTDKRTGYPIGRIDRSNWTLDHKQYIDCHMFHGIQNDDAKFKKTLEMLHTVWPKEDWKWWINYVKEFKKLMK